MPNYWFPLDFEIVSGDTRTVTLTFETTNGAAQNISAWEFFYKAIYRGAASPTITVADASMTKSDSGSGTVDMISIPLDNSITAIAAGKYDQEIAVRISGEPTTIAKGTLTIHARVTTV